MNQVGQSAMTFWVALSVFGSLQIRRSSSNQSISHHPSIPSVNTVQGQIRCDNKDAICLSRRSKEWCPSFETAAKGLGELKNGVSRFNLAIRRVTGEHADVSIHTKSTSNSLAPLTHFPSCTSEKTVIPFFDRTSVRSRLCHSFKEQEKWHYSTFVP